jgi:hypothetical protein
MRHAPQDEEMSRNTYPLKLPTSVKKAAAELAATDGVWLNQFIAAAVAEKVGSPRAADDFRRERAGTAKPKDMLCPFRARDVAHRDPLIAVPLAILDFLRLHPCIDSNGCVGRLIARKAPFRFSTSMVYALMLFATRCALSCE